MQERQLEERWSSGQQPRLLRLRLRPSSLLIRYACDLQLQTRKINETLAHPFPLPVVFEASLRQTASAQVLATSPWEH